MQVVSQAVSWRFLLSGDMVPILPGRRFHRTGIIISFFVRYQNEVAMVFGCFFDDLFFTPSKANDEAVVVLQSKQKQI